MSEKDDPARVPIWARYALIAALITFLLAGVIHGFPLLDGPPPKPMFWNPYEHIEGIPRSE